MCNKSVRMKIIVQLAGKCANSRAQITPLRIFDVKNLVINAIYSYFVVCIQNGYEGFSGYNRIQLMMLDDRKVPKQSERKSLAKTKNISYYIRG